MFLKAVLVSVLLSAPALCAPTGDDYTLFEELERVPKGWTKEQEGPNSSDIITLRIHVKQQNVQDFEKKLIDVCSRGELITLMLTASDVHARTS